MMRILQKPLKKKGKIMIKLLKVQREDIRKQDEIILQMERLIDTQFQYIESYITPRYNRPQQEESPIYKSI
jgi:predicted P-loop ATPase/GTPase